MDDVKFAFFVFPVQLQISFHGFFAVISKRIYNGHLLNDPFLIFCEIDVQLRMSDRVFAFTRKKTIGRIEIQPIVPLPFSIKRF